MTSALDQVRTALITGHLDQRITVQGRFDPLVGVFAPDNQTKLRKAIAAKQDFGLLVRIAPGSTPAAVPPRVKGDTTVSTTVEHGPQGATRTVLEVTTNYVWVYPFAGRTTRPGDQHGLRR